jgi:hypothetical protein
MTRCLCIAVIYLLSLSASLCRADVTILPPHVTLSTPESTQRLILQHQANGEATRHIADGVVWSSGSPDVATVDETGVVRPVADGAATITANANGHSASIDVTVSGINEPFAWSFRNHVLPVLAKAGCNSGACHGALAGKGGFRLSLRGYDPPTDHFNIVQQDRGRRIEFADPGRSLFLAKPSGAIPHKGGLRFTTDSREYRILSEWIAAGAAAPRDDDPRVDRLEIFPGRSLHAVGETQQLLVSAVYSNGRHEDVTGGTKWSSSN